MTPDRDEHRTTTVAQYSEAVSASAAEQKQDHDVRVSIVLFVLLVAVALQIPVSGEIGDSNVHRHGLFAQAIDLIINVGLSIGMALLLISGRPRGRRGGAGR